MRPASLQAVLCQLDGTARTSLTGEIDAGGLASITDVIDDDSAGPVSLAHGQSDIEVGPGHYATGRADTVCGHPPEEEVGSSGTDIRIEKLGDGRASGCGGIEDLPG